MKKVMLTLILLVVVVSISGCKPREKKINGIVCRMYGFNWTPIACLCVSCGDYELSKYCEDCGTMQSLVVGRAKCTKCGKLNYVGANYCGYDGSKNELILVER